MLCLTFVPSISIKFKKIFHYGWNTSITFLLFTISVVSLGHNILSLRPKVESIKTLKMKGEVKSFLQDYKK